MDQTALQAEGQTYHGFTITKYQPLTELQSTLIELVHEKTGAKIMQIANQDPENLFSLSFQTIPENSSGAAHILEHTVLCGSKQFPVKDPFFSMSRRSLNTYMNALTGQDFTCYPASSQVQKDFYNLLEVYLDAVFYPKLDRLSFLQEGHRLCFTEKGNPKSPLLIQGVVYNEMKGALSDSDQRLSYHLFKHLFPDLTYRHNSGGDPKEIPKLSYEDLLEFHRAFYHPSRCLFFFYGNLPLSKHLEKIAPILEQSDRLPQLPPLPLQKKFTQPIFAQESYPIATHESLEKKSTIALGFLTAPISEQTELLALSLIDSLLADTDVSPLKYALIQSGLCTMADSSIDLEMSEAPWVLVCKGCDPNSAKPILSLFRSTLEQLCESGFSPDAIEASLHQLEFQRTEIGGEGVPFGLSLFFRAALAKQHGADPKHSLLIHSLFEELKNRLVDRNYLPNLLRRYFLDNPHFVCLSLEPDPHLAEKEHQEEKEKLAAIKHSLKEQEIQAILDQEARLREHQSKMEEQSLDCLPAISLKEVPSHAKDYPLLFSSSESMSIVQHNCFTNRILYADLVLDLPHMSHVDLSYLPLLAQMVTEMGTETKSYSEMLDLQQASVGELSAKPSFYIDQSNPNRFDAALVYRAKALDRKTPLLFNLLKECALKANFQNPSRVSELFSEHATALQNSLVKRSMGYAMQSAMSLLSPAAALQDLWHGFSHYRTVENLKSRLEELPELLHQLFQRLLGAKNPTLVLGCNESDRKQIDPHLHSFAKSFEPRERGLWDPTSFAPSPQRSYGVAIASPVAFSALAMPTISYTHPDAAPLILASSLFDNLILHAEIREKGGAYGSGSNYIPSMGLFTFFSYRDPHLARTYEVFYQAIDRIGKGEFSENDLEEAKLSFLQDLDAPLPPGQRARAGYGFLRTKRTYALRDAWRNSILHCTKEEVLSSVSKHLPMHRDSAVFISFAGKELLERDQKKLPIAFDLENFSM